MSHSHFYKKLVGWDLLNVCQKRLIGSAKESKAITFQGKTFQVFDMTKEQEYTLFITAASDRGILEVLKNNDIFRKRPYLSCSLMTKETGSFKVNPSLLQAKLILQFNPKQVVYALPHGFWSPTDKYNSREAQSFFLDNLQKHMHITNHIEEDLRASLVTDIGKESWHKIPETVQTSAEKKLETELLKNIKGEKIDLKPLVSPQSLVGSTLLNVKNQSTPYNEVILVNSGRKDYSILAIAFEDNDFENAMRTADVGNEDALLAMQAIIESKIPIIITKSQYQCLEEKTNPKEPENKFLYASKTHDLVLLEKLCAEYDVKLYGGKALQEACYMGDFEIVKRLIQHGADVNFNYGMPIQAAFYRGFVGIASLLVEDGAETHQYRDKLLESLRKRPNEQLAELLLQKRLQSLHG